MKQVACAILFAITAVAGAQTQYTVTAGATDEDGIPLTAARLCLAKPKSQCYVPPDNRPPFGLNPSAHEIGLSNGSTVVLFTAESYAGGSGSATYIALLDCRREPPLDLLTNVVLSNQSEHILWNIKDLSSMPVFVTAEFNWADGEGHFGEHRYTITSYIYNRQVGRYLKADSFVTGKKYPGLDSADTIKVLESEKRTILARLRRPAALPRGQRH